ncbi:MAG: c-type cytochrome [Hyphomicrobium sp.]
MDSFELTKVAGAALAALLLIFGTKTMVEMKTGHPSESPGYALPGSEPAPEEKTAAGDETPASAEGDKKPAEAAKAESAAEAPAEKSEAAAPADGGGDVVALLAKANADNGKAAFSKCKACHVVEKGKASTVGPNLWGVVNRKKASLEGFAYSEAMKAKGGDWSFDSLSQFLRSPKGYVAGTKMVFNGVSDPAVEADLIAYLASLADTPVPLPK